MQTRARPGQEAAAREVAEGGQDGVQRGAGGHGQGSRPYARPLRYSENVLKGFYTGLRIFISFNKNIFSHFFK